MVRSVVLMAVSLAICGLSSCSHDRRNERTALFLELLPGGDVRLGNLAISPQELHAALQREAKNGLCPVYVKDGNNWIHREVRRVCNALTICGFWDIRMICRRNTALDVAVPVRFMHPRDESYWDRMPPDALAVEIQVVSNSVLVSEKPIEVAYLGETLKQFSGHHTNVSFVTVTVDESSVHHILLSVLDLCRSNGIQAIYLLK